ncbi:hypothetical protein O181_045959 [Austropuccinia psidii MF-1]|uniref:RRM domain-containing protein n=1 Tax=Austropuccinia psidii MF-1 TaxID=1389203 RepID=A0A9Q3HKU1_9BASI|nr:hypothetical protein [Austropuccinia psidii MF-1]
MAELDLYGDLYGDVDDCGSPVALSPSHQHPSSNDHHAHHTKPDHKSNHSSTIDSTNMTSNHDEIAHGSTNPTNSNTPVNSANDNSNTSTSQPTTFSISTYEDPSYPKKKHDSHHHNNHEAWKSDSSHPRPPPHHSDSSGMGGRPGLWGVKPSEMPDEGKMFVGGLNWETTEDALKQYFSQFGSVVHCTIMRDPTNGRSRGFAFLTFADPAVVNKVMVKEHFLDGKLIDPKRAIPRGSGPGPSGMTGPMSDKRSGHHSGENTGSLSNKLFCRGMPEDATPQSFRAFWSQYNSQVNIEEAVLMMDRDSNRHRGFGFINLASGEDAETLLRSGPFVMDGHPLEVKRKAPSRSRNEGRDDMNKMGPAMLDRYGAPYGPPGHHDPSMFHPAPMGGYYKGGMPAGGWKGWNPGMIPSMGGGGVGHSRGVYMGMGMPHEGRGMAHDGPSGMGGGYNSGYSRQHGTGGYGQDWRAAGPPSMRAVGPGPYPPYHHSNPPSSAGAARNQRGGPRNYAPY